MLIIGIDEVARGCLAGPVVSCAFILKPEILCNWSADIANRPKITDSKRMTPAQRQIAKDWLVADEPTGPSLAWGLGRASVQEIDEMNIREATFLAMNRALEACLGMLTRDHPDLRQEPLQVWVDGNSFKPLTDVVPSSINWAGGITYYTQVKGDLLVPSIACASILAKEFRDAELDALVASNPDELGCYGWASNRAYGTADHFRAILQNGLTVWHRLSFLDKLLAPGRIAES
jgi:ribonuclease HII